MFVRRLSRICWVLLALFGAPGLVHAKTIGCPGTGTAIVNAIDAFYFLNVNTDTQIQILWTDSAGMNRARLIPAGYIGLAVSVKAGTYITYDCLGPGQAEVENIPGLVYVVLCGQALNQTAFENTTGTSFNELVFIRNNSTVPITVSYQDPSGKSAIGTIQPKSDFDLVYGIGPGGQLTVVCPRILTEGADSYMEKARLP